MLPTLNIQFTNGNLAITNPSEDGLVGLIGSYKEPTSLVATYTTKIVGIPGGAVTFNVPSPTGVAVSATVDFTSTAFTTITEARDYLVANMNPVLPFGFTIQPLNTEEFVITSPAGYAYMPSPGDFTVTGLSLGAINYATSTVTMPMYFTYGAPYFITSLAQAEAMGILDTIDNHDLHKFFVQFYSENLPGTPIAFMAVTPSTLMSTMLNNPDYAYKLLNVAQGSIKGLFVLPDATTAITEPNGLDADVLMAAQNAYQLRTTYIYEKAAPFFVGIPGIGFNGDQAALPSINTNNFEGVGILLGDSEPMTGAITNYNVSLGLLAGRFAKNAVHRNIGAVADGALLVETQEMYLGDALIDTVNVTMIHDKGFITFRTHTGFTGYFFTDDPLAVSDTDDYYHLTNRRVIDKAYRIVHKTLSPLLLADIPVTNSGTILPTFAKTWEGKIIKAIADSMTANGELSSDPNDPNDTGVKCKIKLTNNILSSQTIQFEELSVRPKGYARYINVPLGFINVSNTL